MIRLVVVRWYIGCIHQHEKRLHAAPAPAYATIVIPKYHGTAKTLHPVVSNRQQDITQQSIANVSAAMLHDIQQDHLKKKREANIVISFDAIIKNEDTSRITPSDNKKNTQVSSLSTENNNNTRQMSSAFFFAVENDPLPNIPHHHVSPKKKIEGSTQTSGTNPHCAHL